jgi:hypothetical protein
LRWIRRGFPTAPFPWQKPGRKGALLARRPTGLSHDAGGTRGAVVGPESTRFEKDVSGRVLGRRRILCRSPGPRPLSGFANKGLTGKGLEPLADGGRGRKPLEREGQVLGRLPRLDCLPQSWQVRVPRKVARAGRKPRVDGEGDACVLVPGLTWGKVLPRGHDGCVR